MAEALLVVFVIVLVAFAVLLLGTVLGSVLRLLAAYFFAPLPSPPSLERLQAFVARDIAERRAAAVAALELEPRPPVSLVALRSLTTPLGIPPSLPRVVSLVDREEEAALRRPQQPVPEALLNLRAFIRSSNRAHGNRSRPGVA